MVRQTLIQVAVIETIVGFEHDYQVALLSWQFVANYLGLFEVSYQILIIHREDRDNTPISGSYHLVTELSLSQ